METTPIAENPRARIGGNNPPTDAELLREHLALTQAAIIGTKDELLNAAARLPLQITDDEQTQHQGNVAKEIQRFLKATENARAAAKEPHLTAGRTVDGFFAMLTAPLADAKRIIEARQGAYLRQKAERERRAAIERARVEREEAERKAQAAEAAERDRLAAAAAAEPPKLWDAKPKEHDAAGALFAEAVEHETQARRDERLSVAKPADLARTRSDRGVVSTLVKVWKHKVVDPASVPRQFLTVDETLIRSAIRDAVKAQKIGELRIAGVEIYSEEEARNV